MNNAQYLAQISQDTKPSKDSSQTSLLDSPILRIVLAVAVGLIVLLTAINIFRNLSTPKNDSFYRLNYRSSSLITTITTYNKSVKSSSLRSTATSLSSALEALNVSLTEFYNANNISPKTLPKKFQSSETTLLSELETSLNHAKLNGILDRTYAHELSYQISLLITLEETALNETSDKTIKSALSSSLENLKKLRSDFDAFSETK